MKSAKILNDVIVVSHIIAQSQLFMKNSSYLGTLPQKSKIKKT